MGKKKVIQKSEEELLKERERVEASIRKEIQEDIKKKKKISEGNVYISSSYNNTIITLTDNSGNVIAWASSGNIGYKGTKKGTPYAASKVAELITQKAKKVGVERVNIFVKGIGTGRDSAIRSLAAQGMDIVMIKDVTPIPHNGCKRPRRRRV
jgi:small subunit ribosomal protein S11